MLVGGDTTGDDGGQHRVGQRHLQRQRALLLIVAGCVRFERIALGFRRGVEFMAVVPLAVGEVIEVAGLVNTLFALDGIGFGLRPIALLEDRHAPITAIDRGWRRFAQPILDINPGRHAR